METPSPAHFSNARDRSRRPSHTPTTTMRSGISAASDFRRSAQSSDRSVTDLASSPQPSQQLQHPPLQTPHASHLVHRFQDDAYNRVSTAPSSTGSSGLRPARESSEELKTSDSRPLLSATSSYLQEKLLRERRFENERCSSRMSNDKMSVSPDLRATQSSPAGGPYDIHRPKSSGSNFDAGKKKSVGLKEMEQILTSLHKQNFDLKLELYHRREKQTTLEERCENLETEKHELEDMNDRLMSELEMRDKAVEEAVAMIISLEARLEQLLQQRETTERVNRDHFFATDAGSRHALSSTPSNATSNTYPTLPTAAAAEPKADDVHSMNRMPSFISERSERTENLRNVFLGARGNSLISLPRTAEDLTDAADPRDAANRIASPSLSVLSESSFLSIYGKKKDFTAILPPTATQRPASPVDPVGNGTESPPEGEVPDGSAADVVAHALATITAPSDAATNACRPVAAKALTPGKTRSSSANRTNTASGNLHSLAGFLGKSSPLQQLEQMELSLQAMNDASPPTSQENVGRKDASTRYIHSQDFSGPYAKQEKKDALRRVRTDAPFAREHHNLPPTPDTISTSTLRRYKNSSDTLSQDKEVSNDRSSHAVSDAETSWSSNDENKRRPAVELSANNGLVTQPPSTTAFNSRRHEANERSSYFDSRLRIPARPRSADETTLSHHGRGSGWGDSESSEDDLDIDGNDSASLHDYWLRESLRPTGQALAPTQRSRSRKTGRLSPDLFNFPTTSNGWATTAMFGTLDGRGYHGSVSGGAGAAPLAHTLDALGASLPTPAAGLFESTGLLASPLPYSIGSGVTAGPPPPPNRRSSLHAQTGSTHGIPSLGSSSRSGSRHGTITGTPGTPGTPAHPGSGFSNSRSRKSPVKSGTAGSYSATTMSRSDSYDSRAQYEAAPDQQQQITLPKQRHYPPTSGSNSVPRNRVLSLFRRSGSHEQNAPTVAAAAPSSAPPMETTFASAASSRSAPMPAIGTPSRVRRSDFDDETNGVSSTPPPILRNPRNPLRGSVDSGSSRSQAGPTKDVTTNAAIPTLPSVPSTEASNEPATTAPASAAVLPTSQAGQPSSQTQSTENGTASRKKWLGLGRVTSLRNRAG